MARNFAIVLGAVYALVGVLGFVLPSPLLGYFPVNAPHSIVHLAIGAIWLMSAFYPVGGLGPRATSAILGPALLVLGVLGFILPDLLDQLFLIETYDNFLHIATGAIGTYVGYFTPRETVTT